MLYKRVKAHILSKKIKESPKISLFVKWRLLIQKTMFLWIFYKKNRQNVTLQRLITNEILSCFHSDVFLNFIHF